MQLRETANPSLVRVINLQVVFDLIDSGGPTGTPELARHSGLSKPTVADVVTELLDLQLLRKVGRRRGSSGPTTQLYDINPRAGWVLSIEIGREWVRAALSDLTGTTVSRTATPTVRFVTSELVAQLRETSQSLCDEAEITLADLDQVVLGIPGVVQSGEHRLSATTNVPALEAPNAITDIETALTSPLLLENDINLAALGEHAKGAARGIGDFVLLSIGTGVGMGVVLNGELHRGARGFAGEVGYLALDVDEVGSRPDGAPGEGTFEGRVSEDGVVALARQLGLSATTASIEVFEAARRGDPIAAKCVEIEARRVAKGIAAISAVLDPELVVLGGDIGAGAGDLLVGPIGGSLPGASPFAPRLAISTLGTEGVLAGAGAVGLRLALGRCLRGIPARSRSTLGDWSIVKLTAPGTPIMPVAEMVSREVRPDTE
jgi:predicted NBD/HSP70 family sugar kinase